MFLHDLSWKRANVVLFPAVGVVQKALPVYDSSSQFFSPDILAMYVYLMYTVEIIILTSHCTYAYSASCMCRR